MLFSEHARRGRYDQFCASQVMVEPAYPQAKCRDKLLPNDFCEMRSEEQSVQLNVLFACNFQDRT
jgi:hypothetical protein